MTSRAWLLLGWVIVGAAALLAYVVVAWQALRAPGAADPGAPETPRAAPRWRFLALIPPLAPGVAWALGRRAGPIVLAILVAAYVGLRLLE